MEVRSLWQEPEREVESFGALEFHDVFKIFRSGPAETVALRGLDFRIEPGEFVAVLGPSGSGKSTMLHLAAGLEQPSAGDVRIHGRSLTRLTERTLVHQDVLRKDLAAIRRRGYAKSNAERQPGSGSVAAPIFDHHGRPAGVISVCGPLERFRSEEKQAAEALLETTNRLSAQMGHAS